MTNYLFSIASNVAIFSILALSLNIITGYAGQAMMGHAAFFGIGAYSAALLTNAGLNFWLALPDHCGNLRRHTGYRQPARAE